MSYKILYVVSIWFSFRGMQMRKKTGFCVHVLLVVLNHVSSDSTVLL